MLKKRRKSTWVSLAIVALLLVSYAACWWPTQNNGVVDVADQYLANFSMPGLSSYAPEETILELGVEAPLIVGLSHDGKQEYYFWLFGYVKKLPYERDVPPQRPILAPSSISDPPPSAE